MDPRLRPVAAPADPRVRPVGAGASAPRNAAVAVPGIDEPGDLPDPGPDIDLPPPWFDPAARRHACPENLPGEYRRADATRAYTVGPVSSSTSGQATIYTVGGSLLASADRVALEQPLATFLATNGVPNGAIAVLDSAGRLIHCAGLTNLSVYQYIREQPSWAGPHSGFRVGSVSKTFTAWAACRLADLEVFGNMQDLLHEYVDLDRLPEAVDKGLVDEKWIPQRGARHDDRAWRESITLEHLLTHRGGWFDDGYSSTQLKNGQLVVAGVYPYVSYPMTRSRGVMGKNISSFHEEMAEANRATWPVTHDHMLRYFNLWPLAFEPGSHYCYSNLGYWMLGRAIEGASCRGYDAFVREALLRPLGMRDTRVGPDLSRERGLGELPVFGYRWPGSAATVATLSQSFQGKGGSYTTTDLEDYEPYAERRLRLTDAAGGWVSSAYDLALYARETFYRQALFDHKVWYGEMLRYQGATGQSSGMGYGWESGGWHGSGSWFKTGHVSGGAADVYHEGSSTGSRGLSLVVLYNRFPFTSSESADKATDKAMRKAVVAGLQAVALPSAGQDLFRIIPP